MLLPLQVAVVVTMLASPAGVLGIATDEDCRCFMCVCDLDPYPPPPEAPTHHPPPAQPQPVPSPPPPPPPAPAVPAYYPPPTGYYYYPPQPYGYPWPTTYGPPAGEMYPRDDRRRRESKSGAAPRHGGCGRASLALAVALASGVLALLLWLE
jgi:hypothetical protein